MLSLETGHLRTMYHKDTKTIPGTPPINTGSLWSIAFGFSGPTTWLTSESTSSCTTFASLITERRRHGDQQEVAHEFSMTGIICLVWVVDLVFARLGVSHQWQFVGGFWHRAGPVEDTVGTKVLLGGALDHWWQCSGSRLRAYNGLWFRKTVCLITPDRGCIRMQWGFSLARVPGFPSERNQNACGKGADSDLFCSDSGRHPKSASRQEGEGVQSTQGLEVLFDFQD